MGVDIVPISPGDGKQRNARNKTKYLSGNQQNDNKMLIWKNTFLRHMSKKLFSFCEQIFLSLTGTTFPKPGQTAVVHYTGEFSSLIDLNTLITKPWRLFRNPRQWNSFWLFPYKRKSFQIQDWKGWSDSRMGRWSRSNVGWTTRQTHLLARFRLRSSRPSRHHPSQRYTHLWRWTLACWISNQNKAQASSKRNPNFIWNNCISS